MAGIAKEAIDRASSSTILSQANTLSLKRQLSGGYDQRYMRAAKEGAKIQYFKDPFKVILSDIKEFQVELYQKLKMICLKKKKEKFYFQIIILQKISNNVTH